MIIELVRAWGPDEIGEARSCAICAERFPLGSVRAEAVTMHRGWELGYLCPSCVVALGNYRPDLFPTIGEYEAALSRYPEPIFADEQELRNEANWDYAGRVYRIPRA